MNELFFRRNVSNNELGKSSPNFGRVVNWANYLTPLRNNVYIVMIVTLCNVKPRFARALRMFAWRESISQNAKDEISFASPYPAKI